MRHSESSVPGRLSGYAYEFQAGNSVIHRLGARWKLVLWFAMSTAAFAAREPWAISALLILNLVYYSLSRLSLLELWKDIRFFLIQMALIVGFYVMRYGTEYGIWAGTRTTLQILLFFMPGMVFLRTTQSSHIMRDLKKILPARLSFLIVTSMRFIPFFAREFHDIAMAQRLRGARLTPRRFLDPRCWKDFFNCLMIPIIVRALKTSNEAALSAEARAFDRRFIQK